MEDKVIGTNYYATELPTEGQIAKMQTLLMKRQLQQVQKMLEEVPRYHIGKQSGGWQFLFAPHIKQRNGFSNSGQIVSPWEDTLESITNYLSREDVKIEDEYGKSYTCKQFFNKISVYNDPENAINGEQYDQKYPSEWGCEKYEYTTNEGLRFSTDEDFS